MKSYLKILTVITLLTLLPGCSLLRVLTPSPPAILMTDCPDFQPIPERSLSQREVIVYWLGDIQVGRECKSQLGRLQEWIHDH